MKSQILIIFLFLALALWGAGCDKNKSPTSPKKEPVNGNNTPPDIQYVTHPQTDIPWPTLAESPCPIANYNPQRVARSKYTGPKKGKVKWTLDMGGKATYAPVVGVDGTIYLTARGLTGYRLIAVSPEGQIKWEFKPTPARQIQTSPIIAADNSIILGTAEPWDHDPKKPLGVLYVINPDGSVRWQKELPLEVECRGGLIDLEGNLYFTGTAKGDGNSMVFALYSFNFDGTERWAIFGKNYLTSYSYISMSPDGSTLYVQSYKKDIYAINANDGSMLWRNPSAQLNSAPVVDSDGNIYTYYDYSGEYGIVSYDPAGEFRWRYNFLKKMTKLHQPLSEGDGEMCLNHNGYIYSYQGARLFSCDYIGQERWLKELPSGDPLGETPVTCSVDSIIYLTGGPYLYAYNQNGELLFECEYTGYERRAYAGSLACDGVAYILDNAAILIAVE